MFRYHHLVCKQCGKHFEGNSNKKYYCSTECFEKRNYAVDKIVCPICREYFTPRIVRGKRQIFCSRSCRWQYERNKTPIIICERCGKEFKKSASFFKFGNPRFCSQSCAGNMKRSENERFRRLKTPEWETIKKSILKRDGYKCKRCGVKDMLTVHHIKRWVFTKDDSPSNLITLCRSCHYSIEWNGVECPTP